jgi:putative oxidoreductase
METRATLRRLTVFQTSDSWAPFILRALLAVVIFPHGAQKLFGIFGGYGFAGTMEYFTSTVGIPYGLGLGVILLETLGTLLLLSGLATRLLALSFTLLGLGIMFTSHIENGFFMNWYANQTGEGIEYFLLWIAMTYSLVITGGGKFSMDGWLYRRWLKNNENYWVLPGQI